MKPEKITTFERTLSVQQVRMNFTQEVYEPVVEALVGIECLLKTAFNEERGCVNDQIEEPVDLSILKASVQEAIDQVAEISVLVDADLSKLLTSLRDVLAEIESGNITLRNIYTSIRGILNAPFELFLDVDTSGIENLRPCDFCWGWSVSL